MNHAHSAHPVVQHVFQILTALSVGMAFTWASFWVCRLGSVRAVQRRISAQLVEMPPAGAHPALTIIR